MPDFTCIRPKCQGPFSRRKDCVLPWKLLYCCPECRKRDLAVKRVQRCRAKKAL